MARRNINMSASEFSRSNLAAKALEEAAEQVF